MVGDAEYVQAWCRGRVGARVACGRRGKRLLLPFPSLASTPTLSRGQHSFCAHSSSTPTTPTTFPRLPHPPPTSSRMSRSSTTRNASHAGSWYTDDGKPLSFSLALHRLTFHLETGPKLDKQLSDWLKSTATGEGALQEAPVKGCKAIIAPCVLFPVIPLECSSIHSPFLLRRHAGYSYSGPAAAYAYNSVEVKNICVDLLFVPSIDCQLTFLAFPQLPSLHPRPISPLLPRRLCAEPLRPVRDTYWESASRPGQCV